MGASTGSSLPPGAGTNFPPTTRGLPQVGLPCPIQTEETIDSRKEKSFYNWNPNPIPTLPNRTDLSRNNGQKTHLEVISPTLRNLVGLSGPSKAIL